MLVKGVRDIFRIGHGTLVQAAEPIVEVLDGREWPYFGHVLGGDGSVVKRTSCDAACPAAKKKLMKVFESYIFFCDLTSQVTYQ